VDRDEIVVINSPKNIVKERDAIERLKFNHSIVGVEPVADPGPDGEFDDLFGLRL
jgi:hypothetical protein